MLMEITFHSVAELQHLQEIACDVSEPVSLHSEDDGICVDAKSFIGLFTLDFSKPVKVVTESPYVIRKLETMKRKQEQALA